MNEKRSRGPKPQAMIVVLLLGLALGVGIGMMIANSGRTPAGEPAAGPGSGAPANPPQQPKGPTPQEVAEEKGVAAVIKDPTGDYELISVVEGPEANLKLAENLQIIGVQRQRLLVLARQFEALPADAKAQRELFAGQIEDVRNSLEQNLGYMAKTYGYSLRFNYRLVTHAATLLLLTTAEDGATSTELVHEFKDAVSYANFQALRQEYVLRTVEEVKKQQADAEAAGEERPFVPSADLQALGSDLITLYDYDPVKSYQVDIQKSALYARPGTQPEKAGD